MKKLVYDSALLSDYLQFHCGGGHVHLEGVVQYQCGVGEFHENGKFWASHAMSGENEN